ncbi:MAG: phosphocholine cytidylyltransferase family protein [Gammaproteobacteria bacterium]|nr:phosphocholine cytidylyltransferase family protein [Gammaproteobacteria bacterium]MCP5135989.1 phosphocholine cytidylyltransferase family protein [Gammaproteobacteria bacterium]
MKAIILAAGRGSRMKQLTDDRPKCMVELKGKPLLEWQLEALRGAGVSEIAVVTGYMRERLQNINLKEFFNPRWSETQMLSSLATADDWLSIDSCIVSYSDIFYDENAVKSLVNVAADISILYDVNWRSLWESRFDEPLLDAESLRLNPDGTLKEIGKRAKTLDEIQGQYMGLLRFTPRGWQELSRIRDLLDDKERASLHMTGALQMVLEEGRLPIYGIPYDGVWGEVDSADDLHFYNKRF